MYVNYLDFSSTDNAEKIKNVWSNYQVFGCVTVIFQVFCFIFLRWIYMCLRLPQLHYYPGMTFNFCSFCLYFPSASIIGMFHHACVAM